MSLQLERKDAAGICMSQVEGDGVRSLEGEEVIVEKNKACNSG